MTIKQIVAATALIFISSMGQAQAPATQTENCGDSTTRNAVNYVPQLHGVVRGRYELDTQTSEGRFAVRNARVMVTGQILPQAGYYVRAECNYNGRFMILDAWGRVRVAPGLDVIAGQVRIPMSTEGARQVEDYWMANRSYVGRYMGNYSGAGVRIDYNIPGTWIKTECGVYNAGTTADHNKWSKSYTWAGRAVLSPWAGSEIAAGFVTLKPYNQRMNQLNASLGMTFGALRTHAEVMRRWYCNSTYKTSTSWMAMADYAWPVQWGLIRTVSVQGRYDGITDCYDGNETVLPTQQRITLGTTVSRTVTKRAHVDVRLNYEHIFFAHDVVPRSGEGNRLLAELVVVF